MDAQAKNDECREAQFGRWMACHQGLISKVARSFVRNEEDVADLVQEIRLQLWLSLPRYQGAAKESTWIYRVCLNTAMAWKRSERRWRARRAASPVIANIDGSEARRWQDLEDRVARLYAAIRRLPRGEAALVLLYLDDLSYREMGEVLGLSESLVGVKLHRARKALSRLMADDSHE